MIDRDELRKKIIVALDLDSSEKAVEMVQILKGEVGLFKVGLELFTACGPDVVRRIRTEGAAVFLDLKLYDIPHTVARAVRQIARLGVEMLTLHAYGGPEMIQAAVEAASQEAGRLGIPRPKLMGVTILTSQAASGGAQGPASIPGISVEKMVVFMAKIAEREGLDGVIASPHEVNALRQNVGPKFLIVTPGIRPQGSDEHDQKRTATPQSAVEAGADYLVIGRPITQSADPLMTVRNIIDSICS